MPMLKKSYFAVNPKEGRMEKKREEFRVSIKQRHERRTRKKNEYTNKVQNPTTYRRTSARNGRRKCHRKICMSLVESDKSCQEEEQRMGFCGGLSDGQSEGETYSQQRARIKVSKWFCTLDLKNGYCQMPLLDGSLKSKDITSFVTPLSTDTHVFRSAIHIAFPKDGEILAVDDLLIHAF
eukprot:GHVP01056394.1.p1 GENE.GHVP01056394.1~~GHVP01056394.1.p1  ORF type:complete len:180 (+),score=22.86 GHVP01056394.1:348-887(+)